MSDDVLASILIIYEMSAHHVYWTFSVGFHSSSLSSHFINFVLILQFLKEEHF